MMNKEDGTMIEVILEVIIDKTMEEASEVSHKMVKEIKGDILSLDKTLVKETTKLARTRK